MLLRALGLICAAILGVAVIGLGLDFFRLFGIRIQESFALPALLVMAGVGYVASQGKSGDVDPWPELLKILGFLAALIFVVNFGNWIIALAFLGAYAAVYAMPFVRGCNYLFVRRPLERHALKQQTLSVKLGADSELAEATLRHERARAALAEAEAEDAVQEAERTARARRP
jgi:hypothetical protein